MNTPIDPSDKDFGAKNMKKLIAILTAGIIFILSCAHWENLSEEEKEKYRKAKMKYDWLQRSGP